MSICKSIVLLRIQFYLEGCFKGVPLSGYSITQMDNILTVKPELCTGVIVPLRKS